MERGRPLRTLLPAAPIPHRMNPEQRDIAPVEVANPCPNVLDEDKNKDKLQSTTQTQDSHLAPGFQVSFVTPAQQLTGDSQLQSILNLTDPDQEVRGGRRGAAARAAALARNSNSNIGTGGVFDVFQFQVAAEVANNPSKRLRPRRITTTNQFSNDKEQSGHANNSHALEQRETPDSTLPTPMIPNKRARTRSRNDDPQARAPKRRSTASSCFTSMTAAPRVAPTSRTTTRSMANRKDKHLGFGGELDRLTDMETELMREVHELEVEYAGLQADMDRGQAIGPALRRLKSDHVIKSIELANKKRDLQKLQEELKKLLA
ncbi:hypothetical protein EG329_013862 [Mollisiaceae sp. DMI_Dod_QoI]|nr:hypothetical protein EG329_013862 [Helotiales sp. DMI_Dod_QoI]